MKTKIIFFFLMTIATYAQRPKMHLIIAADVEDNAYTVRNFSKEEKIKNMFSLVCRELGFNLQTKYLHTYDFGFSAKGVLDSLSKIKILTRDDIVIFYYLGRGYYPSQNTKVPLLEFQDTKKMLSFDQIRKKLTPLKARLSLIVADCDESFSLLNPGVLPHSLIKTSRAKPIPEVFEKAIYAALNADFSNDYTSEDAIDEVPESLIISEDSIYAEKCILELNQLLINNKKHKADFDELRHISLLNDIISEYSTQNYPSAFDLDKKLDLYTLLNLENRAYRTEVFTMDTYKLLVDTLFMKRAVLDFKDPINILIRKLFTYENKVLLPTHWSIENQESVLYYLKIMDDLSQKLNKMDLNKPSNSNDEHVRALYARLDAYKSIGLPYENVDDFKRRKNLIGALPQITKANFKTLDFKLAECNVLIDSLFLKKSLEIKNDPLNLLLDSLIEFANRPLISPIEFLTKYEVDKYYDDLDKLDLLISTSTKSLGDTTRIIRLKYFFKRLGEYPKIGFPDKNIQLAKIPSDSKSNDINNLTDFLFIKNALFEIRHPLQLKLDSIINNSLSIHTLKLNRSEWVHYVKTLESLDSLMRNHKSSIIPTKEVLKIAKERLKEYPESGFPDSTEQYKPEIDAIPYRNYYYSAETTMDYKIFARNQFYGKIIDSLYISNQILNDTSRLYLLINDFLFNDIPKGLIVVKSLNTTPPTKGAVIMQLFLSECGMVEVANGHSKPLKKNQYLGNYTDFVTKNFDEILDKYFLNDVGKLSLSDLFSPMNKPFIHDFRRSIPLNCSVVSSTSEFILPDFKKLPTEGKVSQLFDEYIKSKNLARKKALKSEITGYFEKKALLKVKPLKPSGNEPIRPINISIKEYFVKLDNSMPKVDSVGVREGSVKRNKNFSKITSMMVVEN